MSEIGERAVEIARAWIGTPYHHQASVRGVGCDCLGLVRGVYAELYGAPAETPPPYSRDLAEATGVETLLEAARRHLDEVAHWMDMPTLRAVLPVQGDVLIFRLRPGAVAKHCGIYVAGPGMIHAFEGASVCEVSLSNWWRRHIAAVFRFLEREVKQWR
mgnify:CR=1 FL=1